MQVQVKVTFLQSFTGNADVSIETNTANVLLLKFVLKNWPFPNDLEISTLCWQG